MIDDKDLNNNENQNITFSRGRALKVVGGSDFEAVFDNSSSKMQTNYTAPSHTEEEVANISREELEARLAANKAEMESIASSIRAEMALNRENTNIQFAALNSTLNTLSAKIDGKMDSVDGEIKAIDGKIEGINGKFEGIQNQIGGINTAISGIQSGISSRLAIFGIIIAVLVAVPGLISTFKDSSQPAQVQPAAPIIIQVPPVSPQVVEAPPTVPLAPKSHR